MSPDERKPFSRYRIVGHLKTVSPLHIGSGEVDLLTGRTNHPAPGGEDRDIRYNKIFTDHRGKPSIPGSTLKGLLAGQMESRLDDQQMVYQLFGAGPASSSSRPAPRDEDSRGGRLLFSDARFEVASGQNVTPKLFQPSDDPAANEDPPLQWDPARHTYVLVQTAIDRQLRTAEHHKLHQYEVVPPETSFEIEICGDQLTDTELGTFLHLLKELESETLELGGSTSNGFGRCTFTLDSLQGIRTEDEVREWLQGTTAGYQDLPDQDWQEILQNSALPLLEIEQSQLRVELHLQFEGPMLINDPSSGSEGKDVPSHHFLRDADDSPVFPGTSFRGAIRAQAERILRTIGKEACLGGVCRGKTPAELCAACCLFGAAGWAAPLTFAPPALKSHQKTVRDFVAIDRFTGGAAKGSERDGSTRSGRLFKAKVLWKPEFEATVTLDLMRLEKTGIAEELAGLLILLLRDLIEGDIRFGMGSAKGFGRCKARVLDIRFLGEAPKWLPCEVQRITSLEPPGVDRLAAASLLIEMLHGLEGVQVEKRG